jgi:RNA polymerase sigma-70 factor (ECF subfamily)
VAELLDLSVSAVNSALHRARTRMADRDGTATVDPRSASDPGHLRTLLDRYVRAWESADVAGLIALLREEAVVAMPPGILVSGRQAIGAFLAGSVFAGDIKVRLVPLRANRVPAFAVYSGAAGDPALRMYAVIVLDVAGSDIARMDVFADPRLATTFGIAAERPA